MKKPFVYTYIALIVLTLTTALFSSSTTEISKFSVATIMIISALKFFLIAFWFMELKKANTFWKVTLSLVLSLIVTLIILLK